MRIWVADGNPYFVCQRGIIGFEGLNLLVQIVVDKKDQVVKQFTDDLRNLLREEILVLNYKERTSGSLLNQLMESSTKNISRKTLLVGGVESLRAAMKLISMGLPTNLFFIPDWSLPLGTKNLGRVTHETMLFDLLFFLRTCSKELKCCISVRFDKKLIFFVMTSKLVEQICRISLSIDSEEVELLINPDFKKLSCQKVVRLGMFPSVGELVEEDIEFSKQLAMELARYFDKTKGNHSLIYTDGFHLIPVEKTMKFVSRVLREFHLKAGGTACERRT